MWFVHEHTSHRAPLILTRDTRLNFSWTAEHWRPPQRYFQWSEVKASCRHNSMWADLSPWSVILTVLLFRCIETSCMCHKGQSQPLSCAYFKRYPISLCPFLDMPLCCLPAPCANKPIYITHACLAFGFLFRLLTKPNCCFFPSLTSFLFLSLTAFYIMCSIIFFFTDLSSFLREQDAYSSRL